MNAQVFSPHFHSDGGADTLSIVIDYAKRLREDCSILKNPATGRFHSIRQYDVERRVRELGWIRYVTLTVVIHTETHLPDEQL